VGRAKRHRWRCTIAGVAVVRRNQGEDLNPRPLSLFAFFAVPNLCFRDGEALASAASKAVKKFEPQRTQMAAEQIRPTGCAL
jgi:hypothetical protein